MTQSSLPWGAPGDVGAPEMYQDRWRALFRSVIGNGVVNDEDDTYLRVTATGSDTTVQVSAGEAVIEGVHYVNDAVVNLNVASVGSAPTSGQTRIDLVVLRYDPVAQSVTLVVKPGTPASSGAAAPALTRSQTGVWEHSIAKITRVGNVSVTSAMITEYRRYAGSLVYNNAGITAPDEDAPAGALLVRYDDILVRRYTGGSVQWRSLLSPTWTNLTIASGYASSGRTPQYRVKDDHLEVRGVIRRSNSADFPVGTGWLTIASVSSTLTDGISSTWPPRVPCAMTDVIDPGMLQLLRTGQLQLGAGAAGQGNVFLDGCRFPLS